MTDQELKEAAALLPLDLLAADELSELESAMAERPALRAWARDLHETAAALLLADSPPCRVPDGVLAEIHRRTAVRTSRRTLVRTVTLWGGWAAAAVVTLLLLKERHDAAAAPGSSDAVTAGNGTRSDGTTTGAAPGSNDGNAAANSAEDAEDDSGGSLRDRVRTKDGGVRERVRNSLATENNTLRRNLQQLMVSESQRFQDRPGQVRVVFSEMIPPGARETPARRLTPERLGEIIAAEVTGASVKTPPEGTPPAGDTPPDPSRPESPREPVRLRPGDAWNNEIIVEQGMADFGMMNIPPDVTLRHGALPVDDPDYAPRFTPLPDQPGSYYDSISDVIWKADPQGGHVGYRPGPEFNRDTLANPPPPAAPEAPAADPAAPSPLEPDAPQSNQPPAAWTVFDETTGQGSLIYDSLPPAPAGMAYRLSFTDSRQGRTIEAAVFQSTSSGRIAFDLGAAGYTPSGYTLSLGPAAPGSAAGARVILSGPGQP